MRDDSTDAVGVLASGAIEQGSEVHGIDGFHNLRNERLLRCLTEVKLLFEFFPDILGGFNDCGCASRGNKGTWIAWGYPGVVFCSVAYRMSDRRKPRCP